MKCVMCRQADTQPGVTTLTLEQGESTFVVKEVPANVCPNCGEAYVDGDVTAALLQSTEALARSGKKFDVRTYAETARAA